MKDSLGDELLLGGTACAELLLEDSGCYRCGFRGCPVLGLVGECEYGEKDVITQSLRIDYFDELLESLEPEV